MDDLEPTTASPRTYTYNGAGRLITAAAVRTGGDPCEKRTYSFDVNGNRTTLARQATSASVCATTSTTTLSYDAADRLLPTGTGTGLVYDAWGRTTTLPTALAGSTGNGGYISGATGNLTTGYYLTDMAATQAHSGNTDTWTLDPNQRLRRAVLAGTAKTNHYDDSTDSPAWIDEGFADGSLTRYIAGLDGGTVGYIQTATTPAYTITRHYLTDLHGDVKTTTDPAPAGGTPNGATYDTDEYGVPYGGTRRYGWLGDHQRSTDALAGTFLMGARIYAPTLGRFLTTDPVHGGNDTTYGYPNDPINMTDLDGKAWNWKRIAGGAAKGLSAISFVASYCWTPVCQAIALGTGAASAGLYYAAGEKRAARSQLATTAISGLTFGRGKWVRKSSRLSKIVNTRSDGLVGLAVRYKSRGITPLASRKRVVNRTVRFGWAASQTLQHTYAFTSPPRRR